VFGRGNFPLYFANSFIVTVASVVLVLLFGAMAAFALSEYRYRLNTLLGLYLAIAIMIPIRLGTVAHLAEPAFNAKAAARELRQRFERRTLAEVLDADIKERRIAEIGGWVMPDSLAQLCLLAAG